MSEINKSKIASIKIGFLRKIETQKIMNQTRQTEVVEEDEKKNQMEGCK